MASPVVLGHAMSSTEDTPVRPVSDLRGSPSPRRTAATMGSDWLRLQATATRHRRRQLDRGPTPLELLPAVVDAIDGRAEVYIDTGITTGADVVAAVGLGAKAATLCRASLYGLMAGGQRGVSRVPGDPARRSGTDPAPDGRSRHGRRSWTARARPPEAEPPPPRGSAGRPRYGCLGSCVGGAQRSTRSELLRTGGPGAASISWTSLAVSPSCTAVTCHA